jgi:hypothetical protein
MNVFSKREYIEAARTGGSELRCLVES